MPKLDLGNGTPEVGAPELDLKEVGKPELDHGVGIPEVGTSELDVGGEVGENWKHEALLRNRRRLWEQQPLGWKRVTYATKQKPQKKNQDPRRISRMISSIKNLYIRASNRTVLPMHALCMQYYVFTTNNGHN